MTIFSGEAQRVATGDVIPGFFGAPDLEVYDRAAAERCSVAAAPLRDARSLPPEP